MRAGNRELAADAIGGRIGAQAGASSPMRNSAMLTQRGPQQGNHKPHDRALRITPGPCAIALGRILAAARARPLPVDATILARHAKAERRWRRRALASSPGRRAGPRGGDPCGACRGCVSAGCSVRAWGRDRCGAGRAEGGEAGSACPEAASRARQRDSRRIGPHHAPTACPCAWPTDAAHDRE